MKAYSGEIWLPVCQADNQVQPVELNIIEKTDEVVIAQKPVEAPVKEEIYNKSFEEMTVEELQQAILERMKRNGPVTEQMKKDVFHNIYHNSLVTWIKSFN